MEKVAALPSVFPALMAAIFMTTTASAQAESLDLASDADGVSTLQSININAANTHFDPDLTLNASQVCGWRAAVKETRGGAIFQIRRGAFSGPESLQSGISLTAEDGGGQSAFVPAAGYASGVSLSSVSTSYETLGWVKSNGNARFRLRISVSSKSKSGSGSVSGTISIIGAVAP